MSDVPRFGTDGVRGVANAELTPEVVLALGRAAARVLGGQRFLVGRDTRRSGPLLFAALSAGLTAEGADVVDLGVLPTPGLAYESATLGLPGAMISASHNPYADNGVKFFSSEGRKLSDAVEASIEAEYRRLLGLTAADHSGSAPTGAAVGVITDGEQARRNYAEAMIASLEGRSLAGRTVVLDCANGAASEVAPEVVRALGAQVMVLHNQPDGLNINDHCGSTYPELLQAAVIAHGAHLGLAFDGDADRCLAVDADGQMVDGDQIMAMCAVDLRERGALVHNTVVVTVMTNLGFKLAMADAGITVVQTKVGDRYVLEALEQGGFSLGGEQSGHVIFAERATTGDGLLSGLAVMDLMCRSGRTLADLASVMSRLPQVLRNVRGVQRSRLDGAQRLWREVELVEAELAGRGRVLLRPSGTEDLVRVMVEAPTAEAAEAATDRLCRMVAVELA